MEGSWNLFAEEDGVFCFWIDDYYVDEGFPYSWELSMGGVQPSPDEYSDKPRNADTIEPSGTFSGVVNSPYDTDVLKFSLEKGDSIEVSMSAGENVMFRQVDGASSFASLENAEKDSRFDAVNVEKGLDGNWKLFAEEDGVFAFWIADSHVQEGFPFSWEISMSGVQPSPDEYPDKPRNADTIEPSGTFSGVVNSPYDTDVLKFSLQKGESIRVSMSAGENVMFRQVDGASSFTSLNNAEEDSRFHAVNVEKGVEGTWKIYAEQDGVLAFWIADSHVKDGFPFSWEVSLGDSVSTPTTTTTATPTTAIATTTTTAAHGTTTIVTPTPTTTAAALTTTINSETRGETQDSDEDGVKDSEDYAPRDPDVQDESDLTDDSEESTPGFGVGVTVVALLVTTFVVLRRS